MRRYLAGGSCRMEMLRRDLDDPVRRAVRALRRVRRAVVPDRRCPTRGGHGPGGASTGPASTSRSARTWPTGMAALGVDVKGTHRRGRAGPTGRAVARLSDIGWGTRLRELRRPRLDRRRGDAARVVGAVVDVLKAWGWAQRPVAVVAMPSRTRPQLIASVAERIAELGKLPLLGSLAYDHGGPTGGRGGNSAHRLAAVWERVVVPADVAAALAALDGPVLLVDDIADSRWTITVAARELRRAGAPAVLPLVLAIDG